jgi:Arc/MetJ family transcription regulator
MAFMRTTIELDDHHRAELLRLAAQRREKGFSSIVREALDFYLRQQRGTQELVERALALEGSFSEDEAERLRATSRSLRGKWR